MSVGYVTSPTYMQHEMGAHHPERPGRLSAINDRLIATGTDALLVHVEAVPADIAQLERVHDSRYIARILSVGADLSDGEYARLDPDTSMNQYTATAALHAAGGVAQAVDAVTAGDLDRAFCAVRPPGHHACRDRAMGFCFFNNVAVGAAQALLSPNINRVAIVDFDVHHGNGTEDIVQHTWPERRFDEGRADVLFCSTFQHPFYPYSGADTVADNIVNVPLPAFTRGEAFREAIASKWLPALDAFAPDLLIVSAGFDGHAADEMSQWLLQDADYAWVSRTLCEVADKHAGGRLVSCLEGGYERASLGRCVDLHIRALAGAS